MQRITALVRSAMGYTETDARRDALEVVNVQFAREPVLGEEGKPPGLMDFSRMDLMRIIELVAALIAALAFTFFVLRPLVGGLVRGTRTDGGGGGMGGVGGGALAAPVPYAAALPSPDGGGGGTDGVEPSIDIAQIQGRVRASSVKKVAEVIEQHPDESIQIIRGWLNNAM
jgi:flagellar M-ring protein FliF